MFRKIFLFFTLVFFAFLASAKADSDSLRFFISPDGNYTAAAIELNYVSGKYYLFIPGETETSEYQIGFLGSHEGIMLNGKPVPAGTSASVLLDENELTSGQNTLLFSVVRGSQGLPVLHLTTQTGSLEKIHNSKKYKEPGFLVMYDGNGKKIYDGNLSYLKMRGNASVRFPKKNYQIKLETGKNLLGMGKARKWILTGNWLDKSFIRNELSFDLAEYMGLPYTPDHRQVEVYINHKYTGLYLFSEKVEIHQNRINIHDLEKNTEELNKLELSGYEKVYRRLKNGARIKAFDIPVNPQDFTGGYLIEYETLDNRYNGEPSGFITKREFGFVVKSPEYASAVQVAYIASLMQSFENAIFSEDGTDPDTGKHYDEIVEKDSLIKKYLLNEFSKNYDGNSSSEFFFKPADSASSLIYAGPVWDLDNSFGDYAREYNEKKLSTPDGFFISRASTRKNWWPNLYSKPDFYRALVEYFNKDFRAAIEILLGDRESSSSLKSIREYAEAIRKSAEMNYLLYPHLKDERGTIQTGLSFQENIDYLHSYITRRMAFLEQEWIEKDETNKDLQFLVQ